MSRILLALLLIPAFAAAGDPPLPVIDMHLHATAADAQGPPPVAICAPYPHWPTRDPRSPDGEYAMRFLKEPPCERPLWSAPTDQALMEQSLQVLERLNIWAVTSGPADIVKRWEKASGGRVIPALEFQLDEKALSPGQLRTLLERGDFKVLGEVTNQYLGIAPDDPRFEPYLALAEELDVPIAIHVGPGPPGTPYLHPSFANYRASHHSPLGLEEVLRRHPRLRIYVMHAGWPMLDEMLTMMYTHPQLHADIAVLSYVLPREEFDRYVGALVKAGFGKRIVFGSDQMVWPQTIEIALNNVRSASFLTKEQVRDILYNNAARFLRLSEEEMARHHGHVTGSTRGASPNDRRTPTKD